MPTIDQLRISDTIVLGTPTTMTLASSATGGGALSGSVRLSSSNDIFFGAEPTKKVQANPNGSTELTLVRSRDSRLRSPSSVKLFIEVKEVGVGASARRSKLVDIR